MDQKDRKWIEDQYNVVLWTNSPKKSQELIDDHLAFGARESRKAESMIDNEMHVAYGPGERERMNIFGAASLPDDAPIYIYVHGGYWQFGDADCCSHIGVPLVKAGAVYVSLEYNLTPKLTISEMVEQVRRGIAAILQMADRRKSRGVVLAGHSAGGHLAGMALADCGQQELLQKYIKGVMLISGIYDLRPMCKTSYNENMKMTEAEAWASSLIPVAEAVHKNCPQAEIIVTVGALESGEFRRQSLECQQALESCGCKAKYVEVADHDHFTLVQYMLRADYQLTKEAVRMMGLQQ